MASDQTRQQYVEQINSEEQGTGVFLRIGASGDTTVSFRQNLSYDRSRQLGEGFAAFRWVPTRVMSYEGVVGSRCEVVGERCSGRPGGFGCGKIPGCLCNPVRGECVDASGNSSPSPNSTEEDANSHGGGGVLTGARR
jgi:hypothetical protein